MAARLQLPVDQVLPEVLAALRNEHAVVLKAPPGAGKTTRVPPALLASGLADNKTIVVLEPRRLAAQAAAHRMADEQSEQVGQTFGYQIRFERRASDRTRVLVVTEGIFLRMLLDDPFLEKIGIVVFDEFHERNLNSDLALALSRRLQLDFRPDLKLVVMSATLDPRPIASYLKCPVVTSEGRLFPVDIQYLSHPTTRPLPVEAAAGAVAVAPRTPGDLLVFLPGVGEIRRTHAELAAAAAELDMEIVELYGDLPPDRQEAVLRAGPRRRIILSTNVAETSVTIEGVTAVVDSGYARSLRCDPNVGLNRLELTRISRQSADQRAGRAGRTQPGRCLRLWPHHEWRMFQEWDVPEIARLEFSSALLQLHAWGEADPLSLPWFEPPPRAAVEQAETLLRRLGAIHNRGVTDVGRQLARLPVHPRLGRLLLEGERLQCAPAAATAAALLSERDPFLREQGFRRPRHVSESDLVDRVAALEAFDARKECHSAAGTLQPLAAKHLLRVRERLLRERNVPAWQNSPAGWETRLMKAVVAGFPDRVARRREPGKPTGVLVGGRGVRLAEYSAVRDSELFVCVEIEEVGASEALVRQASHVERDWLPENLITRRVEVEFDSQRERVVAFRRTRYEDLLLDQSATDVLDSDDAADLLAKKAAEQLDRAGPLREEAINQFLARVHCLRQWMPELDFPAIGEAQIRSLLPQLARGRRSFADLKEAPWLAFLKNLLTPQQLAKLDREAPEHLTAASGRRIKLDYQPDRPPVMAVRIQDMFGQRETPRVAAGRVAVLLHLLGPNMRPQQVTDDLRGFWERTYPIVRKELKRRYPKHAWPENP